jgi:hypothetical protein
MACCRFGFIGSPLPCLNACAAQGAGNVLASPNYNAEADGMVSIIAHETMEIVSDPLINAWCPTSQTLERFRVQLRYGL